jgi:FkbM family methyltransferase
MTFEAYVAKDRRFAAMTFDFLIASQTAQEWYGNQDQLLPERKWCADRIKPGDVILDCGAHHGLMTVIYSKLTGPTGKVIAFEPVPSNAAIARQNATLNQCSNIEVRALGISDGDKKIYVAGENPSLFGDSMLRQLGIPWFGKERLSIRALDDEIPASTKIDFIKIDVEGEELKALRGAHRVLQKRPTLAIEIHNFIHGGVDLEGIRDVLLPLGYRYFMNGGILDEIDGPFPSIDVAKLATYPNPHLYCEPAN